MPRGWKQRIQRMIRADLLLRLALCACVVGLLLLAANTDGVSSAIQRGFGHIVAGILNLFGEGAAIVGNTVQTERFGITVVTACTGLFLTGIFAAAVILFPTNWRAKTLGLGLGVGGIFLLNVIRLVSLYYIGVYLPTILETAHLLVWQSVLIAAAVILWLVWAGTWGRTSRREATR